MNIALILASGSGTRMVGLKTPKQFCLVNNKPLFLYSVEAFDKNLSIDAIVIVTQGNFVNKVQNICDENALFKVRLITEGGNTRQESVYKGLKAIKEFAQADDIVLIHDSARPLISQDIIDNNIVGCEKYGAVETAVKINDTILKAGESNEVLDRSSLYQVQTPQTFRYSIILKAHEEALKKGITNATDDAQLVEGVQIVNGESTNFKITTIQDLKLFEAMLKKED